MTTDCSTFVDFNGKSQQITKNTLKDIKAAVNYPSMPDGCVDFKKF